jgi:hypothetical protein
VRRQFLHHDQGARWRTAVGMAAIITPLALLVGGGLNWVLRALGVTFQ